MTISVRSRFDVPRNSATLVDSLITRSGPGHASALTRGGALAFMAVLTVLSAQAERLR